MAKKLNIVLAQLNLLVGDIQGNIEKHIHAAKTARDQLSADIIVFPELSITGYPPEDLLLRKEFIQQAQAALQQCMSDITGIYCLIGHPLIKQNHLYNACSLIYNNTLIGQYAKQVLPNYGVFDEDRYFISGKTACVVHVKDISIGLVICEDLWTPAPIQQAVAEGARLILAPNASPFEVDKHEQRIAILRTRAQEQHVPIVYVNNVGGQDELIFDGGSMVVDATGKVCQLAGFFNETLLPVEIELNTKTHVAALPITLPSKEEKIYQALVLSMRDYINKNHFPGVLVGVSGGIDSALTLAIAVDALGHDRVHAVIMPSRYTAAMSLEDAALLTERLNVSSETLSIEPIYQAFLDSLTPSFHGKKPDITEENIQARCRGVILIALSNKHGHLVLTTGNRSELAVGYCTLYGDMVGGFAVLKDVPKTLVYELARYRNHIQPVIPERIIKRPPTAELAFDQKDEDSLPPYSILDAILERYLNRGESVTEIIAQGFSTETVMQVVRLICRNEYKRYQAAIGPRINRTSFGKDWRYPITNGFCSKC